MRDFRTPKGQWNISRGDGRAPRWSPDGRFVYCWRRGTMDTLVRARIDRTPTTVVQAQEFVLAVDIGGLENWDLHPHGLRVNIPVQASAGSPTGREVLDPADLVRRAASADRDGTAVTAGTWPSHFLGRTRRARYDVAARTQCAGIRRWRPRHAVHTTRQAVNP